MAADPGLIAAAARIGDRLVADAITHDGASTWIGAVMEPAGEDWELVHRSCGGDLYEGTSGTALFLARLSAETGDSRHRDTALAGTRHALGRADQAADLSLYGGATGVAWAAASVAACTGDDALAARAGALARRVAAAVSAPGRPDGGALAGHDVMSGSAGVVAGLVALSRPGLLPGAPAGELVAAAEVLASGLVAAARDDGTGLSWPAGGDEPGLCGLGHGAAGPAGALRELAAVTGESRWRTAAEAAERYERGWFSPEHGSWPDLRGCTRAARSASGPPAYACFWCHGAVGVGLQRLRAHELGAGAVTLADAGVALQAAAAAAAAAMTQADGEDFSSNPSLCHGLAGLADLFTYAAALLDQPAHRELAARLAGHLAAISDGSVAAWPSGVVGGGRTPGLMLGASGIGEVLLRAAGTGPRQPAGLPWSAVRE